MKHTALFALTTGIVVMAAGCPPPPNFLDGSIKDSNDLTFDTAELRFIPSQAVYQLSYFKTLEETDGADTVAKVTFNEPAGGVVVDQAIDITTAESEGRVERVTAAGDTFPSEMDAGLVTFTAPAVVDQATSGEFNVTFTNGKTLNGTWGEIALVEVDF